MNFLRLHVDAFGRVGMLALLMLLVANLAAGCALYDAFNNDPEDENNGNNGGECSSVEVEGREDACLVECTRSSEFTEHLDTSQLNACDESEVCASLYREPTGGTQIERLNGVCITREERAACSQLSFEDFEEPEPTFEPCDTPADQYHVAARSGGGFVVAGCRFNTDASSGTGYGVRVLWLDEFGRLDGAPAEARVFIPIEEISEANQSDLDPGEAPTVYALEGIDTPNADGDAALITVKTKATADSNPSSTVGTTRKGSNTLGDSVFRTGRVEPCTGGVDGGQHIAQAGDWFIVGSCFHQDDNPRLGFFVGELDTSGNPPIIVEVQTGDNVIEDGIIQDLSVPFDASDMPAGQVGARALLVDSMNLRLNSVPLVRNPVGDNPFKLGRDSGRQTEPDSVSLPQGVGYEPLPTASQYIETSGKPVTAAQGVPAAGGAVVPKIFPPSSEPEGKRYGKAGSADSEQAIGLVQVGEDFRDVATQPTPGSGSTTWALLTVVGSGSNAFGRLYGLDPNFEVVWTVELGRESEFMPQQIASSKDADSGRMAIVGRTSGGEIRMFFTDSLGRGFCEVGDLEAHVNEN
ncbi:MAG: hypothetical protein ACQEVA_22195 [Myxococcota bacterium]